MDKIVTKRAFLTGFLLTILTAFIAQYSVNIVHGTYMAIDHMPVAGIFLFFVLVFGVNSLLKAINRTLAFSPGELLLVFMMVFIGSSVAEMGLGSQILPILAAPAYYASPSNQWESLIISNARSGFLMTDFEAARSLFEGLPSGGRIPWGAWIRPLAIWIPFILAIYFVMICVVSILRKQWIEKERLAYPLTVLPLEMVKEPENKKSRVPALLKNPVFIVGFSIAFLIGLMAGLRAYFPMVPAIPLEHTFRIFRRTVPLFVRLSLPVLGFVFFANLSVLFSLWFFALIFIGITGTMNIIGIASPENLGIYGAPNPVYHHFGMGAMIIMVLYSLWLSRDHLKDIWHGATGKRQIDDSDEILSYKASFWGLVFGSLFLTGWLTMSGMPWYIALSFLVIGFIIWLVLTRVVCEGGVPTLVATTIASSQVISIFGSGFLAPTAVIALGMTYVYAGDMRTFPMSPAANNLKIAETQKTNKRMFFWAMMSAIVISIATSIFFQFRLTHAHGGINLNNWYFVGSPQAPFRYAAEMISQQTSPSMTGWLFRGLGMLTMAIFLFMRQFFLWWPFHPIGILVGSVPWVMRLWFSIFMAWLIKILILKYAGVQVYEKAKFFFIGLPLGIYTAAGIWFFIDLLTGKTGNLIFWI